MVVTFDKPYLRELYENSATKDKKHRFQPDIIKRYIKGIDILKRVKTLEELYLYQALNYEKLTGNKAGLSSIRVNNKYRIEFEAKVSESQPVITICNIIELSNHYK